MTDDQPIEEAHPVTFSGLRGYKATELAAFSDFYRRFTPRLVRFLRSQGAEWADAAEIAQDTMTKAWHKWSDIQQPEAWVHKVAGRELVRRVASLKEYSTPEIPERSALLPDDVDFAALEQRHDILRVIDKLPPRQRQVLQWTIDEYTPSEIAQMLQITPEAVRSNLLKARRSIATHLNPSEEK
ncbi:RNA polymerase sigma factor (plasmid) [Nocardia pseudovaccinii]|uniref:RNA polymerase sigma factor n=1 Tax=Nocardia pseudovaccinii TaxID=189540 RepID=UPI003D90ABB7